MAQDVIEKIIEENNKSDEDIASPAQQLEAARKRVMDRIIKRDPEYINRRKSNEEKRRQILQSFKVKQNSFSSSEWATAYNDKKFDEFLELACAFYDDFCELIKENAILKEVTNDVIFEQKNKEIGRLQEEVLDCRRQINQMLTLEETQKVIAWAMNHQANSTGEHNVKCEMYYGPIGSAREIKCSCGEQYDLKDWEQW